MDNSFFPPVVKSLHYEFDGWLGDDILESFPCYIVTESLRKGIESENLTGITFGKVIISKSETFQELYPDRNLPIFFWLKINGEENKDDFFITKKNWISNIRACLFIIKKISYRRSRDRRFIIN